MTVAEKKKYLNCLRNSRPEHDTVLEEITMLRAQRMSAAVKIGDGMPRGSGGGGDLSDYAARLDELERKLDERVTRWVRMYEALDCDIIAMDSPIEQAILRRRYILGEPWERVADGIGYTIRRVTQLHGAALLHLDLHPIL